MGKARTDEFYRDLISKVEKGAREGKTKQDMCKEAGVASSCLWNAEKRLGLGKVGKGQRFIELAPKNQLTSPALEIKKGDITIVLKDLDPSSIKTIISILESGE